MSICFSLIKICIPALPWVILHYIYNVTVHILTDYKYANQAGKESQQNICHLSSTLLTPVKHPKTVICSLYATYQNKTINSHVTFWKTQKPEIWMASWWILVPLTANFITHRLNMLTIEKILHVTSDFQKYTNNIFTNYKQVGDLIQGMKRICVQNGDCMLQDRSWYDRKSSKLQQIHIKHCAECHLITATVFCINSENCNSGFYKHMSEGKKSTNRSVKFRCA